MKKRIIVTHFTMQIIRTYLYVTGNKNICSLKYILTYCGYSPTSPFFLLLSEHKHCHNAATNWNSENARSRMIARLWGNVGTGTRKTIQVMGTFRLLDFTMLRPVLTWRAFWNLWTVYFFNFPNSFSGRGQPRIRVPPVLIFVAKISTLPCRLLVGR